MSEVLLVVWNKLVYIVFSFFFYNIFWFLFQEYDISYEEELEYKYDWVFRLLDNVWIKVKLMYGLIYRIYLVYSYCY